MSKEKSLLLILIIVAHALGIYTFSRMSIVSAESKAQPVIEVSMVILQQAQPPMIKPVLEEKKQIQPIKKSVTPQAIVEPNSLVSVAKSVVPAQAQVVVPTPMRAAEVSKQEAPSAPPVMQKPVVLSGDLSVSCPVRTAPKYPRISLKMDEEGSVVVRVKLDKEGKIAEASVKSSSGYKRLDDAAISAVQTWKCHPAMRDNVAVEAYALQPFEFKLEGN
ncbi:MAG: TonB family protein [Sulfuricurvum sp.]|nr:TonB family protein [Sulfuricurvum sp.]